MPTLSHSGTTREENYMNRTQRKINEFQVWVESHPEGNTEGDSDFKDALGDLDQALSYAYWAAFDLDEEEV